MSDTQLIEERWGLNPKQGQTQSRKPKRSSGDGYTDRIPPQQGPILPDNVPMQSRRVPQKADQVIT